MSEEFRRKKFSFTNNDLSAPITKCHVRRIFENDDAEIEQAKKK
jgi:hypothetical protein